MRAMKTTTVMSVVLVLQTTVAVALSLGMYKSCLYECLNCVNTWGKDLFNGEMCADNCAVTGGRSIDTTCTTFFTRSSRRSNGSRQFLHSENHSGRISQSRSGYISYSAYRPSSLSFRSSWKSRSSLSRQCQQLCRRCESRFTSSMDAHSCLYTCVRTRKDRVSC